MHRVSYGGTKRRCCVVHTYPISGGMIIAMDTPAVISLTFDDGLRCQFDKALPTLNSDGLPATFFLIANDEATHESWMGHAGDWFKIDWRDEDIGMLKKVVQDGHEIGSHSVTHHPQKMPMHPDIEARESRRLIEGWLGTEVSSFCYPYYSSHVYLANAVKNAGYEQARGGAKPLITESVKMAHWTGSTWTVVRFQGMKASVNGYSRVDGTY